MEEKRSKKKVVVISIIVGLILIAGIGLTIAYFSSRSTSNNKTITTGNLSITYQENSSETITLNNIIPIYDNDIESEANKIVFSVTNNGTIKGYMDITIEDIVMDNELSNLEFKWALYEGNTKVSNGNFRNVYDNKQLITNNVETDKNITKNIIHMDK